MEKERLTIGSNPGTSFAGFLGGNLVLFDQAWTVSTTALQKSLRRGLPTLLDELKSLFDVTLISYEQEAAWQLSSFRSSFDSSNLGSECNTAAYDTMGCQSIWPELV
jgi:hypothetical protein